MNTPLTAAEEEALRRCIRRGQPFGTPAWVGQVVTPFAQQTTLRPRGRPQKDRPCPGQPLLFDPDPSELQEKGS